MTLAVFGPTPWLRWGLRRLWRTEMAMLDEGVHVAFYLRQIEPARTALAAARDPSLHWRLAGRWTGLSPRPGFDPAWYAQSGPILPANVDPLLHWLREGRRAGRATNPTMASPRDERPAVLVITHGRGGGSVRMLRLHLHRLAAEGWRSLEGVRVGRGAPLLALESQGEPARVFHLIDDVAALTAFAREQGVRRIVVNHLIDFPDGAAEVVEKIADALGASYEVLLHDYWFACPRIDLIDRSGRFCDLPPTEVCAGCVEESVAERRAGAVAFLLRAERVVAPSADAARRLGRGLPGVQIDVEEPEAEPALRDRIAARSRRLRIVIPGAVNRAKGAEVVLALARQVRERRLPISLTVLGPASNATALRRVGVDVQGRYAWGEGGARLASLAPDLIWLPAIWPETWSFTLTEALEQSAPVVVFDIGAPADRLRRRGDGIVLPYDLHARPAALAAALLDAAGR